MIQVDISNIWGELSLGDLLTAEKEVFAAHQMLMEGTGEGSEFRGWLDLPTETPGETQKRILAAAEKIRRESDICLVVGTGGGCLAARGVIELLQGPNRNMTHESPRMYYTGNSLSSRHWNELCRLLEGRDFSVIVISKSGDTLEPSIAFRELRWLLERKYGTDVAGERIYTVTGKNGGALGRMAARAGWECFCIPENVSSPFSVLTAGGLLPMAVAGIDITEVLRGAYEAKQEYDLRSFENPVWLYAAVRNLLYRSGKAVELLESFEPGFKMMGAWWQQLFGGSEGKDGKGLFPAMVELTADLHSLGQLIRDGQRNLFETMVRFDEPDTGAVIGAEVKDPDGLNYLAGRTLDYVAEMVCQGIVDAHTQSGVPVITVDCGELNARTVGQLIYFFQLSCGISAYMLGVNPFDQPGAETYRHNTFRLLGKPEGTGT